MTNYVVKFEQRGVRMAQTGMFHYPIEYVSAGVFRSQFFIGLFPCEETAYRLAQVLENKKAGEVNYWVDATRLTLNPKFMHDRPLRPFDPMGKLKAKGIDWRQYSLHRGLLVKTQCPYWRYVFESVPCNYLGKPISKREFEFQWG